MAASVVPVHTFAVGALPCAVSRDWLCLSWRADARAAARGEAGSRRRDAFLCE